MKTLKNKLIVGAIGLAGLVAADANAGSNCEKRSDGDQICIAREADRTIIYHRCHKESHPLCTVSVSEKGKETEYADLGCTGKATSLVTVDGNGAEAKARTYELSKLFTETIDPKYKELKAIARGK